MWAFYQLIYIFSSQKFDEWFFCFKATILNQMSWLLKTVAIEIKVLTNNDQLSQVTHLLNLLTRNEDHVEPSQELTLDSVEVFSLSHDPGLRRKKEAEKKCLLRRLLNLLKFSHDSVQQPNWNYFEPSMLEKVSLF